MTEVCDTVQEEGIKTIPKKKKYKKAKWLSEEALQNSCEKNISKRQRKKCLFVEMKVKRRRGRVEAD